MTISSTALLAQRRHLVDFHNQARGSSRPALVQNSTLNTMAQGYANQMASKNWNIGVYGHTRPNGMCYPQWWNTKAPDAWKCTSGCTNVTCKVHIGENLARNYSNASAVHNAWMLSTLHRANILDPQFRHVGIGIADSASGMRYWAVEFIAV